MIVIADTSPLHYLVLLEHTEVLQQLLSLAKMMTDFEINSLRTGL
jgi:hypothetical protein